ncbi:hypothetical protein WBG78_03615 [Chryseolinea sp. T2]|uniref:hypothetical protein n=1 Tax=Chryseolinea sp. T2 TaxID=3129255 RepID=UPI0030787E2E
MKFLPAILFLLVSAYCSGQVVKDADVPAVVKATAIKQNKNEAVQSWVLDKNRGKYIATTLHANVLRGIEISFDGKWLQTTESILPQNMPSAVIGAAKKEYPEHELSNLFYITQPDKASYYTIDASSDDEDVTLTIDPSGKILEKEVQ